MTTAGSADLDIPSVERGEVVPLRWLLDRSDLGLVDHHLPETAVTVEWAHAIEVDDPSPWLHGRGLVLTTGLRLSRTRAGQEAYVARLAEAGAGALGIGTGLRLAAVPFGVVAACRDHDLALVEVPFATPFLAVERAVSDRLADLRRQRLLDTLTAQQRLTRATLRDGLVGLTTALATVLRAQVLAVGVDGVVIAAGGPGLPPAEVLAEVTGRRPGPVRVAGPDRILEIQPLGGSPGDPVSWLAVATRTPLTCSERLLVSHAVAIATIELARPDDGPDPALGAAVLSSLLGGRPLAADEALTARGLDPRTPLSLVALRTGRSGRLDRVLPALRRQAPLLDAPLPRETGPGHVVLCRPDAVAGLLAALPAEVTAVSAPPMPWTGLGRVLPQLGRALASAATGDRVDLAASPVERAVSDPVLAAAAGPWLAAVRAYDDAHGSDLVTSLRAFLTHHGAWDPAAQQVGIHRHTLRHRVERAAEVGGFDLGDPTHRALLLLALWPRP